MASGKPAWQCQPGTDANALLFRIWGGKASPEIPSELSEKGKDFLEKCFLRGLRKRWTAEMLLDHPFVAGTDVTVPLKQSDEVSTSPRSPFDFPEWASDHAPSPTPDSEACFDRDLNSSSHSRTSPADRIRQLVTDQTPNWSVSESWFTVRIHTIIISIRMATSSLNASDWPDKAA
ncbi:mitogen-activated protein kinase kinase kinase 17-like [Vitis riparia]|uniref:mitogen-activated protein kinase kinase kinase 17-like n=1 Tax=Vitis riparia TaxID=96939 RepID=UPI00155A8E9F|nr:mitogen-activated protein kinase kinase kinase 17-like [Vitis riparia]